LSRRAGDGGSLIERLKLYFDVCCSKRLPPELLEFYGPHYPGLETRHLLQDYRNNSPDSEWLSPLKAGDWIVISCDRGCDGSKEQLPRICLAWQITHVLFTATLLHKGPAAQKNALAAVWEELFLLDTHPRGSRFSLGENGRTRDGAVRYSLRYKSPPPASGS
jgi:hypothetical protein